MDDERGENNELRILTVFIGSKARGRRAPIKPTSRMSKGSVSHDDEVLVGCSYGIGCVYKCIMVYNNYG